MDNRANIPTRTVSLTAIDERNNKFWKCNVVGGHYSVQFGKINGRSQIRSREFDSYDDAITELEKKMHEKMTGYSKYTLVSDIET